MNVPSINKKTLIKWAPFIVLVALIIIVTIINPNFLSMRNFARLSIATATPLMITLGVTFTIILGSIDLSMEGAVAFCAVILATLLGYFGAFHAWGWISIPIVLVIGGVFGFFNGWLNVKLKIPSFMASLGMGFVMTGLAMYVTDGLRIPAKDPVFRMLLTERIGGMPLMFYIMIVSLLVAYFIQTRTVLGRNIYAVGGSEKLAHESGVNVARVRMLAFALAGVFYACGAIFATARIGSVATNIGTGYMFISITSAVVGGTALIGGSGGVIQALLGVMIVSVVNNGMILLGLPKYIQEGVLGIIIIVAIALTVDRKMVTLNK